MARTVYNHESFLETNGIGVKATGLVQSRVPRFVFLSYDRDNVVVSQVPYGIEITNNLDEPVLLLEQRWKAMHLSSDQIVTSNIAGVDGVLPTIEPHSTLSFQGFCPCSSLTTMEGTLVLVKSGHMDALINAYVAPFGVWTLPRATSD